MEDTNVADILMDKRPGSSLYDIYHNIKVQFDFITNPHDSTRMIRCSSHKNEIDEIKFDYSEWGTDKHWINGLQILKPSKQMQDWSKFAWKKGDVLKCGVDNLCIFESWANSNYTEFNAMCVTYTYCNSTCQTKMWTKETNEGIIKQYISNIEEIKGGKLNLNTLTIEKQQKFKDGDFVTVRYSSKDKAIIIFKHDKSDESKFCYYCALIKGKLYYDDYVIATAVPPRFYSKSEKEEFFDALAKEGKRWNSKTLQIEDLPKKCELKPFDKVLVRDTLDDVWSPNFFSNYEREGDEYKYGCISGGTLVAYSKYCIPYNDQTAHLLGTTDEWKGGEG